MKLFINIAQLGSNENNDSLATLNTGSGTSSTQTIILSSLARLFHYTSSPHLLTKMVSIKIYGDTFTDSILINPLSEQHFQLIFKWESPPLNGVCCHFWPREFTCELIWSSLHPSSLTRSSKWPRNCCIDIKRVLLLPALAFIPTRANDQRRVRG